MGEWGARPTTLLGRRTRVTLVSQLLYASPAWWGYLKTDERNWIQSVIKATWYGYLPRFFSTLDELKEDSNEKLFFLSRYNSNHVLSTASCPNLETSVITFVNAHTIWHYLQIAMLLSNKTLSIDSGDVYPATQPLSVWLQNGNAIELALQLAIVTVTGTRSWLSVCMCACVRVCVCVSGLGVNITLEISAQMLPTEPHQIHLNTTHIHHRHI